MAKANSYHHGNLKADLIQAGLAILDEEGIEAVGIRQVARKVGVAHSAPSNHFKNKQSLLTALGEEIFQRLLHAIESDLKQGDDLSKSIHRFCKSVLDFALRYPNRYRLMWRKESLDSQNPQLQASMERVYQKLIVLLGESSRQKNTDVESQAIALWSLIHGYASLRLDGNLSQGRDKLTGKDRLDAIIAVLLEGLS